ncbi:hypothetical protein BDV11DRAFT_192563, partial [Aspergillus similis]
MCLECTSLLSLSIIVASCLELVPNNSSNAEVYSSSFSSHGLNGGRISQVYYSLGLLTAILVIIIRIAMEMDIGLYSICPRWSVSRLQRKIYMHEKTAPVCL